MCVNRVEKNIRNTSQYKAFQFNTTANYLSNKHVVKLVSICVITLNFLKTGMFANVMYWIILVCLRSCLYVR